MIQTVSIEKENCVNEPEAFQVEDHLMEMESCVEVCCCQLGVE